MRARILLLLAPLFTLGCATDLNRINASKYYELGLRAEAAGDYRGAHEAFRRALINAGSANARPEYVSAVKYNLGRMTGYLCDYTQAESILLDSLQTEQRLRSSAPGNITKRLSELARLTYDMGKYPESAAYFERVLPEIERLGVVEKDPVGFALFLEDYASALEKKGDASKAAEIAARAVELKAKHPGRAAGFTPVHYRDVCPKPK